MENNDSQTIIKVNGPISLNTSVELPIDGLPPSIQQYIEAVYNVYHCPREFITVAVLATVATAVGKKIIHTDITMKQMSTAFADDGIVLIS